MPKVEYEVEEGNVDQWFLVIRKRDGKRFTVSKIDDTTSESSIIEVFDANDKERTAIKKALSKYLEQKEAQEIDANESAELLERVAEKLERKGIEPASDVEKLRVLASKMKKGKEE